MKWLIAFLAVFLMALNWVPCTDANNSCSTTVSTQHKDEKSGSTTSHEHGNDHDDTCSPFCTCACCGISFTNLSFNIKPSIGQTLPDFFEKQFVIRSVSFQSSFFGNIWQPPKMNA